MLKRLTLRHRTLSVVQTGNPQPTLPSRSEGLFIVMASVRKIDAQVVDWRNWDPSALCWVIALTLGLIQSWANRFYMGNDGVSYIDSADAYLRGGWHTVPNGSWNPLYSWLVGIAFSIFHPSPYWEYPVVQLLNFLIYTLTVVAFEYFLRGLLTVRDPNETAIRVIAYGLFLWSSLILIGVWTVNADMLVAACVYAAFGILVRLRKAKTVGPVLCLTLGIILTVGYYSKAVMFPISLVVLSITGILLPWRKTVIVAFVFVLLTAPLIVGISRATGHLTVGDTGRVNYAWYVNGVAFRWWQGGPARSGNPIHPPRIMLNSPRVYEFGGVFPKATYPIWYDFSYWYEGIHVWVDPHRQVTVLWTNLKWTLKLIGRLGGGFLLGWGVCFLLYKNKARIFDDLVELWPVWAASLTGILLYCAVHIESRYIGAFMVALLLTGYSAVCARGTWLAAGVVAVALLWAIILAPKPTAGARYMPLYKTQGPSSWHTAQALEGLGLHEDDKVASVCYSNRNNVLWARLARVHIVAETDWDVDFWHLSEADQRRVLTALKRSGALIAVSDEIPPDPTQAVGWQRAGNTNYYAYVLSQL